jgi:Tfp pilus assembly protein PilO
MTLGAFSPRRIWKTAYARPFILLLALNLLVFAAFTLPRSITERRLSAQAMALRQAITEDRKSAGEAGRQIQIINANIAETQRFYETVVPDRKELYAILQYLDKTASESGVNSTRVTYSAPSDVKGTKLVTFEITMPISGTYEQVGRFLQKLERAPHFIIVKQVSMRGRAMDGGVDLDIRVETYFRRNEKGK